MAFIKLKACAPKGIELLNRLRASEYEKKWCTSTEPPRINHFTEKNIPTTSAVSSTKITVDAHLCKLRNTPLIRFQPVFISQNSIQSDIIVLKHLSCMTKWYVLRVKAHVPTGRIPTVPGGFLGERPRPSDNVSAKKVKDAGTITEIYCKQDEISLKKGSIATL